jgi:uncharacterized NAD-dependent epimerase/dehydratase family protein
VALLDSGINVKHPVFKDYEIPQLLFKNGGWKAMAYQPVHGHGTGVASIMVKNADNFAITSFVLFEDTLSVPPEKYISALEEIVDSPEQYDIIHMSLGIRYYNKRLEEICTTLKEKGRIVISALDNAGSISYPAAFPTVIGVDASFRCLKNDDFVFVGAQGIINLKAKGGNQRIAWLGDSYMITQGSSYAASYVTAYTVKLLLEGVRAENILPCFREKAAHIYPVPEIKNKNAVPQFFPIQKAAVFPCNKETTSILRFSSLLNFELYGAFDIKLSGNLGKEIKQFDGSCCHIIKNIDECKWDSFDTMILGHTHDLEYFSKVEIRKTIIEKCLENRVNIFSFDDELLDPDICAQFDNQGLRIYYPQVLIDDVPLKMGRMYSIKTPILGIFGTSMQQGKFTLQLQMRKRFIRDGYTIGQLGSEPESLLFGMDYVYPFGYRKTVDIDNLKSIEYLNYCISQIDRKGCDLIIVGSQAGTMPMLFNHIDNYPLDRFSFLLGTRPDAVILCINFHDKIADIKRTVLGIESLARCKVIAASLFPLGYKNDWDIVRGAKSRIENSMLGEFKEKVTEALSVPCFVLDEEAGPESLYQTAIDFFAR